MEKEKQIPAFPTYFEGCGGYLYQDGMTLLDYFAAKALPAVISDSGNAGYDKWAEWSYKVAAAMLEERKKYVNA